MFLHLIKAKKQNQKTKPSKKTKEETDRIMEMFPFEQRLDVYRRWRVGENTKDKNI